MVSPLGFRTSDKYLKRAGLDYWSEVNISIIKDLEDLLEKVPNNFYFFSSKASRPYTEIPFETTDMLIFGSETSGLPAHFHERWPESFFTIPMIHDARCLNLSNTVAIVIYEAWRQQDFAGGASDLPPND